MKCPICCGGGRFWVLAHDKRKSVPDLKEVKCSICKGTGNIQQELPLDVKEEAT